MAYTLTNLQDDIRNYTEVDSSVLSTAVLNTIIKNAENRIYREVDSDDNRFYATSNLQSGNRYVTIPSDLRAIRYVQLKDGSNNQVFLEKRDTSFMTEYYNTPGTASGLPKYYANWDANFWVVAPTPNSTFEITLAYIKQPDSITSGTPSTAGTYVSNKYQDLLLYACLVEAYGYLKGPRICYNTMNSHIKGLQNRTLSNKKVEDVEMNGKMALFVLRLNRHHHNKEKI